MTDNGDPGISLVDTILNKMFSNLKEREEFDDKAISNLQELFEKGELNKIEKISDTLKDKGGEDPETD